MLNYISIIFCTTTSTFDQVFLARFLFCLLPVSPASPPLRAFDEACTCALLATIPGAPIGAPRTAAANGVIPPEIETADARPPLFETPALLVKTAAVAAAFLEEDFRLVPLLLPSPAFFLDPLPLPPPAFFDPPPLDLGVIAIPPLPPPAAALPPFPFILNALVEGLLPKFAVVTTLAAAAAAAAFAASLATALPAIFSNFTLRLTTSPSFFSMTFCKVKRVSAPFRTWSYISQTRFVGMGRSITFNSFNTCCIRFSVVLLILKCPPVAGWTSRPDWRYGVPGVGVGAVEANCA
mmetsp:Transcript_7340/g.8528  ORF Transcript_7340/g.8528 Transcript_7340/m.8528 type:complete len:294 (+) Transcript_7340:98-979(+)